MIENISYVIVNPEDGASSLEPSQPTVVNDIVLTAQESQVYDTVLKVIKQKEILQKSMEQNYKQLMVFNYMFKFSLFFFYLSFFEMLITLI